MSVLVESEIRLASRTTEMSGSRPARHHILFLDSLRALAAIFVVLHHISFTVSFSSAHLSILEAGVVKILYYGRYAVDLFIVLSGYCLSIPVVAGDGTLRRSAVGFFRHRARRIVPPYYFAMLLSLLLIRGWIGQPRGDHWDISLPVTRWALLAHLLLIQDVFSNTAFKINHAFWSISVEWRIYFLFPLLVFARSRFGAVMTVVCCVVVSTALCFALARYLHNDLTMQYVGLFSLGVLAAEISFSSSSWARRSRDRRWWLWTTYSAVLVVFISALPFLSKRHLPLPLVDYVVGLFVAALLVWSANPNSVSHRVLSAKWLAFCGTFAYSTYLIHAPLIELIWRYVIEPIHFSAFNSLCLMCLTAVPLVLLVSYGFFLLFERPFISKRLPIRAPVVDE
jgi:peptidoglycan/LPS O-acetylase OafA/YrhL